MGSMPAAPSYAGSDTRKHDFACHVSLRQQLEGLPRVEQRKCSGHEVSALCNRAHTATVREY